MCLILLHINKTIKRHWTVTKCRQKLGENLTRGNWMKSLCSLYRWVFPEGKNSPGLITWNSYNKQKACGLIVLRWHMIEFGVNGDENWGLRGGGNPTNSNTTSLKFLPSLTNSRSTCTWGRFQESQQKSSSWKPEILEHRLQLWVIRTNEVWNCLIKLGAWQTPWASQEKPRTTPTVPRLII